MRSAPARRIRIVGISGSGKTRLAAAAAARLGVAHLELDSIFWDANWTLRDQDEADQMLRGFLREHPDGWVADGNWTGRLGGRLEPPEGADLVIWIDHPRWVVMSRIVRRTLRRGFSGEVLWHGNRERPTTWFSRDPAENILLWAWVGYGRTRERYLARVGEPGFVRLAGRRRVARWLDSLPGQVS